MEALKAILKVFGFGAILFLVIIPAFTGTALGIRFAQERIEEQQGVSVTGSGKSSGKTVDVRQVERAKVAAEREAAQAQAQLIREQRKADRQYYIQNFPWGDLILIILCVLLTIGCIIYIIHN